MGMNLRGIPFSVAGSYMAISDLPEKYRGSSNRSGIHLRTVRGGAFSTVISLLVPLWKDQEITYTYEAEPTELVLNTAKGSLRLCYADEMTILVYSETAEMGMKMEFVPASPCFDYIHEMPCKSEMRYLVNCFGQNVKYLVWAQQGNASMWQEWDGCVASDNRIDLKGNQEGLLAVIREVHSEWDGISQIYDYKIAKEATAAKFMTFHKAMPQVPEKYEAAARIASYVDWSSIVAKNGFLTRDAMYMSKNWMCNTWAWDHCFNAVALAYGNPQAAWDQLMLLFDQQDPTGRIPDSVNNFRIDWNYCKPPVHGWALSRMMKVMELSAGQMAEAYAKMEKWTQWWLNYRDSDHDGICEYTHGYDSGWDNATAFRKGMLVELPDLQTYLILQMDSLAELAEKLGRGKEAFCWKQRSNEMLHHMIAHCFEDGKPVGRVSGSHAVLDSDSLIMYIPILLGGRLPEDLRENMVKILKSDKFLTAYGLATESPQSKEYVPDGYWLGPIWAPSTMLLLDGLAACGEETFAGEVAEKFCDLVAANGYAENFDALTGEGLRDLAYTWTPSVFLTVAHDFLLKREGK